MRDLSLGKPSTSPWTRLLRTPLCKPVSPPVYLILASLSLLWIDTLLRKDIIINRNISTRSSAPPNPPRPFSTWTPQRRRLSMRISPLLPVEEVASQRSSRRHCLRKHFRGWLYNITRTWTTSSRRSRVSSTRGRSRRSCSRCSASTTWTRATMCRWCTSTRGTWVPSARTTSSAHLRVPTRITSFSFLHLRAASSRPCDPSRINTLIQMRTWEWTRRSKISRLSVSLKIESPQSNTPPLL